MIFDETGVPGDPRLVHDTLRWRRSGERNERVQGNKRITAKSNSESVLSIGTRRDGKSTSDHAGLYDQP